MRKVNIRCGSDISMKLVEANVPGDFIEFSDPLCQGPISALSKDEFIGSRIDFISRAYELERANIENSIENQYLNLNHLNNYDHIVLWFEHDLFDQMSLIYILKTIDEINYNGVLEIICIGDHPEIQRFIGLGQLSSSQLKELWEQNRKPVTKRERELATAVWKQIQDFVKGGEIKIACEADQAFPYLQKALNRYAKENPHQSDLSSTEKLTKQIIKAHGKVTAGKLFSILTNDIEEDPFLGDMMYFHVLREMERKLVLSIERNDEDFSKSFVKFNAAF